MQRFSAVPVKSSTSWEAVQEKSFYCRRFDVKSYPLLELSILPEIRFA